MKAVYLWCGQSKEKCIAGQSDLAADRWSSPASEYFKYVPVAGPYDSDNQKWWITSSETC